MQKDRLIGETGMLAESGVTGTIVAVKRTPEGSPFDIKLRFDSGRESWFPFSMVVSPEVSK